MELDYSGLDADDLAMGASLYVAAFAAAPWHERWAIGDAFDRLVDCFHAPNVVAIKATSEGRLCGFLIGEVQQWPQGTAFFLKELCVKPDLQRQGVGRGLLQNLEERLRRRRVSRLYLITQRDSRAGHFYAALGYAEQPGLMVMGKSLAA